MPEEFKPIETQEAFDMAVQQRIEETKKQFKDWVSPEKLSEQTTALQAQIDSLKLENLKMKVAQESGLPSELASRLTGTNEKELRADAETLAKFTASKPSPAFKPETPPSDAKTASYLEMLRDLRK